MRAGFIPLFGFVLFIALSTAAPPSASAEERAFDVAEFTSIDASAGVRVIVEAGVSTSVRAEGSATSLARIQAEVTDGTLYVSLGGEGGSGWRSLFAGRGLVYVSAPQVNEFAAASGARLVVRDRREENVSVVATGGARVSMSGECGSLNVRATSGARVTAQALACDVVYARAESGGGTRVQANVTADVASASGGFVSLTGAGRATSVSSSSGGRVRVASTISR